MFRFENKISNLLSLRKKVEIPKGQEAIDEALKKACLDGSGHSLTTYRGLEMEEVVGGLPISDDLKLKMNRMNTWLRDKTHLVRLLLREDSAVEFNFGKAYLLYADEVKRHIESDDSEPGAFKKNVIRETIGGEIANTPWWWTYAPYLLKAFSRKGISENKAIAWIIGWAASGQPESGKMIEKKVTLAGLECFRGLGDKVYTLGSDPKGYSHKLTERIAEQIVGRCFVGKS